MREGMMRRQRCNVCLCVSQFDRKREKESESKMNACVVRTSCINRMRSK